VTVNGKSVPGNGKVPLTVVGGLWPQPGGPVLLTAGVVDLSVRRAFVETWGRTWAKLPADVRTAIAALWRSPAMRAAWGDPTVRLVTSLPHEWAHVTDHGMTMRVRLDVLGRDDAWLSSLLAHELAHVWQAATGPVGASLSDDARDESDVAWLLWQWSFPPLP
jgi:hypothetical protein